MESNWKLREFPVSKEDIESMKKSLERLNICSDTYAVVPADTNVINRKLHHCTVCDVILNSCTQTKDHCNGRKHLARLKLCGKEMSFGPKGENIHTTSPSSGIVSLKSNDLSLKDVHSRNIDSSEEASPTCPPNQSAYVTRAQTATSTPKATLSTLAESNPNDMCEINHLDRENRGKTALQELADTFADSLNDAIISNDMGAATAKKLPKKLVVARCSICSLEFSGLVVLQSHLAGAKHAKKVKSLEILRELETKSHCIIKGDPSKFLKCEVCDAVVHSSQQMQMHIRGMNGGGDGPGVGCFPSMLCSNGRLRDSQVKQQGFKEGFKYMCSACKVYLNSEIQLQQHMNSKKHKEGMMRGQRGATKAYQYDKENDRGMNLTPFCQKKTPKQQGISYWFSQQQKLSRLNMTNNPPLRYMYRGNSTSLVTQRAFPSSLQDYYSTHRYVL